MCLKRISYDTIQIQYQHTQLSYFTGIRSVGMYRTRSRLSQGRDSTIQQRLDATLNEPNERLHSTQAWYNL
jgi:hypothetical protein